MFSGMIIKSVVVVPLLFILVTYCLEVIPESIKVIYTNDKYLDDVHANIRRYSRSGKYYINIWARTKHTWANNISIHFIITEFLHNEYRRSFIEFHYKLCDLINTEPMVGQMLAQKGVVCPTPKGEYRLMNMTVLSQHFPNRWPFQKGGAEINITMTSTNELIVFGDVHVLFKQEKKKN